MNSRRNPGCGITQPRAHPFHLNVISEWIRNTPDYAHLNQKGSPERNELHSYSSFMSKELHEETIEMFLRAARQNPAEQIDADVQSGLGILFNLSGI